MTKILKLLVEEETPLKSSLELLWGERERDHPNSETHSVKGKTGTEDRVGFSTWYIVCPGKY